MGAGERAVPPGEELPDALSDETLSRVEQHAGGAGEEGHRGERLAMALANQRSGPAPGRGERHDGHTVRHEGQAACRDEAGQSPPLATERLTTFFLGHVEDQIGSHCRTSRDPRCRQRPHCTGFRLP